METKQPSPKGIQKLREPRMIFNEFEVSFVSGVSAIAHRPVQSDSER